MRFLISLSFLFVSLTITSTALAGLVQMPIVHFAKLEGDKISIGIEYTSGCGLKKYFRPQYRNFNPATGEAHYKLVPVPDGRFCFGQLAQVHDIAEYSLAALHLEPFQVRAIVFHGSPAISGSTLDVDTKARVELAPLPSPATKP